MTTKTGLLLSGVAGMFAFAHIQHASAAEVQTGAAGACKSALPVFDGNIRTRPLAVQNEGASTAFVSCSNSNQIFPEYRNTSVGLWLQNNTAAAVSVSCTFVDGRLGSSTTFYPQTKTYAAGEGAFIVWSAAGEPFTPFANFSCGLPLGVGIGRLVFIYPGPAA